MIKSFSDFKNIKLKLLLPIAGILTIVALLIVVTVVRMNKLNRHQEAQLRAQTLEVLIQKMRATEKTALAELESSSKTKVTASLHAEFDSYAENAVDEARLID